MNKQRLLSLALLIALFALLGLTAVHSQDMGPVVRNSYYVAADANGIRQVYHMLLGNQSETRQITNAASDVITFGAAYDGLSIAYISSGQLWLQPIHSEEAEALASISATQFFGGPVFSVDGEYIAYADNGVWLLDLSTRETRQILKDVALDASASNAGEYRIYLPEVFVLGQNGEPAKLIVDVGIWEWNTAGVYDLASGELQELQGQVHTALLPVYGEKVLLYGNGGVAGEAALHFAESLDDINTYTEVVKLSSLTDATLFAEQAVEIRPGVVRVFGPTIGATPDEANAFYFDMDLMGGTAGDVHFMNLSTGSQGNTVSGQLSADGTLLPVYLNALWTDSGSIYGEFKLLDVTTGEAVTANFPQTVSIFRWQP